MYTAKLYVRVRAEFGLYWNTLRKMFQYSAPPGYLRRSLTLRPKLDTYRWVIDRIFERGLILPKKQRHSGKPSSPTCHCGQHVWDEARPDEIQVMAVGLREKSLRPFGLRPSDREGHDPLAIGWA